MTVLGAALLMPGSGAQAASEPTRIVMGPFSAVYNDAILAGASEAGRTYTVRSAGFTVNDLQQMKKPSTTTAGPSLNCSRSSRR